jgi:hypothetical protein
MVIETLNGWGFNKHLQQEVMYNVAPESEFHLSSAMSKDEWGMISA